MIDGRLAYDSYALRGWMHSDNKFWGGAGTAGVEGFSLDRNPNPYPDSYGTLQSNSTPAQCLHPHNICN